MKYIESMTGVTLDYVKPLEEPRVAVTEGARAIRNTMYGIAGGLTVASAVVELGADSVEDHKMAIKLACFALVGVFGGVIFSGASEDRLDDTEINTIN